MTEARPLPGRIVRRAQAAQPTAERVLAIAQWGAVAALFTWWSASEGDLVIAGPGAGAAMYVAYLVNGGRVVWPILAWWLEAVLAVQDWLRERAGHGPLPEQWPVRRRPWLVVAAGTLVVAVAAVGGIGH